MSYLKYSTLAFCFHFSTLNFFPLQKLQKQLEFLEVQEEYIKDEQKNLKKEYLHAKEEVPSSLKGVA